MKKNQPIGIFDSGVGGLTVLNEIVKLLPGEDIVYFGDTARVPYGAKSPETVKNFAIENSLFLLEHNVKMIIAACNTVSSVAFPYLVRKVPVPVIDVLKPAVRKAVESSSSGRIGVIGTNATIRSRAYEKQILRLRPKTKVFFQ
ncbi:MAG: glutamate racemase, partial [Candidatus Aureabacteria bacterium]|nr:glutamate racemase [Candidatus Auribacterota bacterium]